MKKFLKRIKNLDIEEIAYIFIGIFGLFFGIAFIVLEFMALIKFIKS